MEAMAKCNPPLLEVTQIIKEAADAMAHYSENHHLLFMLKGRLWYKGLGRCAGLLESQGQLDDLPVCTNIRDFYSFFFIFLEGREK